jgi:hypothetical protein
MWQFAVFEVGAKNEIPKCDKIHADLSSAFYVQVIEIMCEIIPMKSFH